MEVNSGPAYPRSLKELEDRVVQTAIKGHAQ